MVDETFDDLILRVDQGRWLAARFVADPQARADLMVLYAYDHELARAPVVASNALLGEIRLTWWREVLDEVFENRPVRRHPVAEALGAMIRRRALPRAPLEAMLDARLLVLEKQPLGLETAIEFADGAGGGAMYGAALILDPATLASATHAAGRAHGLARLDQPELAPQIAMALAAARQEARALSVAAFPAVLPASLARAPSAGEISKRLRLFLAALTGRL